ncbi:hypothetical protein M427DRAFT_153898 [Gonapodya prolifera JEL478]|uniref:L domain-like protein n=1 Tax=Gonapodya prolifera (strain JEL478) TaxID=1344416 RepID=A0A139AKU8_GONPJ|nr:hypothetical protein M427DRAFT_153898 [Gonapodya prolifera JEL478]|eukprot:KXS17409.1 hypothetical protein M427DRAFT_153898 [Gonapodya prolifera JEL478]
MRKRRRGISLPWALLVITLTACGVVVVDCQSAANDCKYFEDLLDASNVTLRWPRGSCCEFYTEVFDPWNSEKYGQGFNCSADGRITRASVAMLNLKGPLPPFRNLTSLTTFELTSNEFSGPFPDVTGMTNLTQLYGRHNPFTSFPPGVETLVNLTNLHFYFNDISGQFPDLSMLTKLVTLWIYNNNLSGPVDGRIPKSVQVCRITYNNTNVGLYTLTGDIPPACLYEYQTYRNPNQPILISPTPASSVLPPSSTPAGPGVAVIAGAAAGGAAVLLAALGLAFYLIRRRRRAKEGHEPELKEPHWFFLRVAGPQDLDTAASVEYTGPPFVVTQKYDAQAPDEIDLTPGTVVRMKTIYRDGWAACWDEVAGTFGTVPLDCLLLTDHLLSKTDPLSFPLGRGEDSMVRSASLAANSFVGSWNSGKTPNRAVPSLGSRVGSPPATLNNAGSLQGSTFSALTQGRDDVTLARSSGSTLTKTLSPTRPERAQTFSSEMSTTAEVQSIQGDVVPGQSLGRARRLTLSERAHFPNTTPPAG